MQITQILLLLIVAIAIVKVFKNTWPIILGLVIGMAITMIKRDEGTGAFVLFLGIIGQIVYTICMALRPTSPQKCPKCGSNKTRFVDSETVLGSSYTEWETERITHKNSDNEEIGYSELPPRLVTRYHTTTHRTHQCQNCNHNWKITSTS